MPGYAATISGVLAVYSYVRGAEGAAAKIPRCIAAYGHVRGAEGAAAKISRCALLHMAMHAAPIMAEYSNTSMEHKHKLYVRSAKCLSGSISGWMEDSHTQRHCDSV